MSQHNQRTRAVVTTTSAQSSRTLAESTRFLDSVVFRAMHQLANVIQCVLHHNAVTKSAAASQKNYDEWVNCLPAKDLEEIAEFERKDWKELSYLTAHMSYKTEKVRTHKQQAVGTSNGSFLDSISRTFMKEDINTTNDMSSSDEGGNSHHGHEDDDSNTSIDASAQSSDNASSFVFHQPIEEDIAGISFLVNSYFIDIYELKPSEQLKDQLTAAAGRLWPERIRRYIARNDARETMFIVRDKTKITASERLRQERIKQRDDEEKQQKDSEKKLKPGESLEKHRKDKADERQKKAEEDEKKRRFHIEKDDSIAAFAAGGPLRPIRHAEGAVIDPHRGELYAVFLRQDLPAEQRVPLLHRVLTELSSNLRKIGFKRRIHVGAWKRTTVVLNFNLDPE